MMAQNQTYYSNHYFSKVVGHEFEVKQLSNWVNNNNAPHALLLTGPDSVGKKFSSLMFAATFLVNDVDPENSHKLLLAGSHPDLYLLNLEDGKKEISVEAVRILIDQLQQCPYYGRGRLAIIDHAERMSISAANALLKTLEEPAPNTHLILVSAFPHRLPQTVVSRSQQVCFGHLSAADKMKIFSNLIAADDFINEYRIELNLLTVEGFGLMRLENFVEPLTGQVKDKETLSKHLLSLFSLTKDTRGIIAQLLAHAKTNNIPAALSYVAKITADKESLVDIDIFWYLLKLELETKLKDSMNAEIWAKLFEQAIETEQLCKERNANITLQVSGLMTDIMSAFQNN
ncbi:MAG: hypothetical protein IT292_08275 [Deltaproteobacteria bacterium]|nr:hypothetical protein [Deltaproteobacteria bacterium]